MRETIIKLLKSDNLDDKRLGREYLRRFYRHELFKGSNNIEFLWPEDLNRILNTNEFKNSDTGTFFGACVLLFKSDDKDEYPST